MRPPIRFAVLLLVVSASALGVVAPPLVVAEPTPTPAKPQGADAGPKLDVTSDVPAEGAVAKAQDVIRRAVELTSARLPYRLADAQRIVMRLHANEMSYVDGLRIHDETLTSNPSTTDPKSKQSRVLVLPRTEPVYLARVGDLPELARYHIAYETVIQILRKADAPSFDQWPAWYVSGLCDSIAQDAMVPAGSPRPVLVDGSFEALRDARATGRLVPIARLVHVGDVGDAHLRRLEAQFTALHRVLAADAPKYAALHERIRLLPVLPNPPDGERDHRRLVAAAAFAQVLTDVYGPLDALDAKLEAAADALAPLRFDLLRWSQRVGDESVCAAPGGSTALLIETAPTPAASWSFGGEFLLEDFGRRQAEVYFGYGTRDDPRFLKFALVREAPDSAAATLLAYADGAWQNHLRINVKLSKDVPLVAGTWIPARVVALRETIEGRVHETIRFEVGGKTVIDTTMPPGFDVFGGRVGVGAFESVARFRRFELGPPPAERAPLAEPDASKGSEKPKATDSGKPSDPPK